MHGRNRSRSVSASRDPKGDVSFRSPVGLRIHPLSVTPVPLWDQCPSHEMEGATGSPSQLGLERRETGDDVTTTVNDVYPTKGPSPIPTDSRGRQEWRKKGGHSSRRDEVRSFGPRKGWDYRTYILR